MRKIIILLLLLFVTALLFTVSCGKKEEVKSQTLDSAELQAGDITICPVMDSKFTVAEESLYISLRL